MNMNLSVLRDTALAALRQEDPIVFLMKRGKMSYELAYYELSQIVNHHTEATLEKILDNNQHDILGDIINTYLNNITINLAKEDI